MEDTARLALIEMYVNNDKAFEKFLNELLKLINNILAKPHDQNIRKLNNDILKELLVCEDFCSYLKYIGFEVQNDGYVFPQEQTLSKLRSAQVAVMKKIAYCYGVERCAYIRSSVHHRKICKLEPAYVLNTTNPFLLSIQTLFNDVLKYEDEELQDLARVHIPLTRLQLRAFERMREYQKKIKTGETSGEDMPFDLALLAELLSWFKHQFFTWVDRPECTVCGGGTRLIAKETRVIEGETCLVEEYACDACAPVGGASFPRHNDVRALLRTRRGRCGEFANCFALLCRALGYDTRYVFDTTDHVWCEVFDYNSNSWLHADPCEAKLDAPLMYAHGWNKRLSYVIAVSRDDLQDVTWRYTTHHKEVLSRRDRCPEDDLLRAVLRLRAHRQAQVSEPRRRYLSERTLRELAQLLVERKPEEYEAEGRLSGSLAWRQERGEAGTQEGYVFQCDSPGAHVIRYFTSSDRYEVWAEGHEATLLQPWAAGLFACHCMQRKVERDWNQVYLAREEGEKNGLVSWKLTCPWKNKAFQSLSVRAAAALYDTGRIEWSLQFDEHEPKVVTLSDRLTQYNRRFNTVVITAQLSGGLGDVAWQHAQLFRQTVDSTDCTFEIQARVVQDEVSNLD